MKKIMLCFYLTCSFVKAEHNTYGYVQVDYLSTNERGVSEGFQLRRINLINDFTPKKEVRVMADIEYENGLDLSDSGGKGQVKISRGFMQYNLNNGGVVRLGKILTPFGLYNEVHDFSATYLPIDVPRMYKKHKIGAGTSQRLFSKYLTGLSYNNSFDFSDGSSFEYTITIANGEEETNNGLDDNSTPALSLRTTYKDFDGSFHFGFSYLYDKKRAGIAGAENENENIFGLDLSLEYEQLKFDTEIMIANYSRINGSDQNSVFGTFMSSYMFNEYSTAFLQYSHELYDIEKTNLMHREFIAGYVHAIKRSIFAKVQIGVLHLKDTRDYATLKLSASTAF